jgi:carbamate kinase
VGVDIFLIATDVPGVALNYGTPDEKFLRKIDIKAAERHIIEGHFPAGTMAPKVDAAIQFIRNKGKRAVITSIAEIESAVKEQVGTEITA